MNKLDEIRQRFQDYENPIPLSFTPVEAHIKFHNHAHADIAYLLSEVERLRAALERIAEDDELEKSLTTIAREALADKGEG